MGTLQHPDSQVNAMEISPDGQLLAACGYQHIRMFDVHNTKPNPVVNFEGMEILKMDYPNRISKLHCQSPLTKQKWHHL